MRGRSELNSRCGPEVPCPSREEEERGERGADERESPRPRFSEEGPVLRSENLRVDSERRMSSFSILFLIKCATSLLDYKGLRAFLFSKIYTKVNEINDLCLLHLKEI